MKAAKPEKAAKLEKADKHKHRTAKGIVSVDFMQVFPDEPASCSLEAAIGRLTLRVPQALDGQAGADGAAGPEGPRGPQGPQGLPGLDLSRVPGSEDEFRLFVDEAGRLAFYALGEVSLVSMVPASAE